VFIKQTESIEVFATDRDSDTQLPFILDDRHLIMTVQKIQDDYYGSQDSRQGLFFYKREALEFML
jgi:hypothetical protein